MVTEIKRLLELSDNPRYNIKAVVQQTKVNISTLRAWEQRYGVPHPNRSEHGHRLYSERDIALIKWLKQCTDNGLAISQAVQMLNEIDTTAPVQEHSVISPPLPIGWTELRAQLLEALSAVDLRQAHVLVNMVCTLHPLDMVVLELFCPVLVEIGERWSRGQICVAEERVVTNFIRQRLLSLIQLHAPFAQGPRLICACAPGEYHEIGLLTFALLMEQRGWEVVYLGGSMSPEGLDEFLVSQAPALVCFSVSLVEHMADMLQICQQVDALSDQGITLGFAGRVFSLHPEMAKRVPGHFLGNDLLASVEMAHAMGEIIDSERWHGMGRVTYRTNGITHLAVGGRQAHA